MNDVLLSLVAGLVGLALGIVGIMAYRGSVLSRAGLPVVGEPTLPEGSAEVLSVIGRAFVILDEVDGVVRANPASYAYGLVRGHTLIHEELDKFGIANTWATYEGTHTDKIAERFAAVVLPFFAQHLAKQ